MAPQAKRALAEIERRLPRYRRAAILRAALAWGLQEVDRRPDDALKEFGK